MSRKYFGTDGIRGRVGEGTITPEFVLRLGWAAGKIFAKGQGQKVLIGKDTRISGYMFESALEAGLVAAGVDVRLLGPMPTPAIAYLTRTMKAQAGIVISASHNPYEDNGIKFFSANGCKLPDETELAIEAQIDKPMTTVESAALGKVSRIEDAGGRYIEFCKRALPIGCSLEGLKIVVDCAHGATYQVGPKTLRELDAKVTTIGATPDGLNINEGFGSTAPEALQRKVLEQGADLGIAFDGDGDRVLFVDHRGEVVDGDELLFVIAQHEMTKSGAVSGVVGTLMSNMGFELALNNLEIPFARAKVGDRYVKELMESRGWTLGGENSGHIICSDITSTGDGIIAALKVLYAIVDSGRSLADLKSGMSKFPQVMQNVRIAPGNNILDNADLKQAVSGVEAELGARGRVLLRPSGTEPVIRVMVEGECPDKVTALCRDLSQRVEQLAG
ncbi:MAG: phosphoglucosamine mutase [Spongiibacteraceae bacterium]|nr:phosphoglucosamine mutase [Spongiibacteraceae bacterium]